MTASTIRIRSTDVFGNVSYIWRSASGNWECATAGGVPYYLGDKAGCRDVMALRFALADSTSAEEAIAVLEAHRVSPCYPQFAIVDGATRVTDNGKSAATIAEAIARIAALQERIRIANTRRGRLNQNGELRIYVLQCAIDAINGKPV